jgi:peroxiredoxin
VLIALAAATLLSAAPRTAFALKEGDPFPHFTAPDMSGQTINTKDNQKKVILIDFWSIYCSSCIQEMPYIVAMYEKYKDKGLQVYGIDLDVYGIARVKKFIDSLDFKIPYPTIIDAKMEIKAKLGVSMLPTVIVADTAGVVQIFHVGYKPGYEKELEEKVVKLLPTK